MDKKPLISADLQFIIEHGQDYPLAYLAALQLKPILDSLTNDFRSSPQGKHTGALEQQGIPQDVMHTVKQATIQLQEHLFDLQKLMIEHPEQKEHIQAQLDETRTVSGALVETVSVITQFKGMAVQPAHHNTAVRTAV